MIFKDFLVQIPKEEGNTLNGNLIKEESFKAIGRFLSKNCTTISEEVKNHICFENSGAYGRAFNV